MNNVRRKEIAKVLEELYELKDRMEALRDEEQDAFDNMPENLQCSERGEAMESIIDNLTDVCDNIETACDGLESYED